MRPLPIILAAGALYATASAILPFNVTHRLGEGCYWVPEAAYDAVGLSRGEPTTADLSGADACFYGRGKKGPPNQINIVMKRWPSKALQHAWEQHQ